MSGETSSHVAGPSPCRVLLGLGRYNQGAGDKAVVAPGPPLLRLPELHEEMRGQKASLSLGEVKGCDSFFGLLNEAFPGWSNSHVFLQRPLVSQQMLVTSGYARTIQ